MFATRFFYLFSISPAPSLPDLIKIFFFFFVSEGHIGMEEVQQLPDAELARSLVSEGDERRSRFGEGHSTGGTSSRDDKERSFERKVLGVQNGSAGRLLQLPRHQVRKSTGWREKIQSSAA